MRLYGLRLALVAGLLISTSWAEAGTTQCVNVPSEVLHVFFDSRNPVVSADGHYVAFESLCTTLVDGDTNGAWDIFVWDRLNGELTRVSVGRGGTQGDGNSRDPSISWDGRYVAFKSGATNLIAGDENESVDIFVYDREIDYTSRVSEPSNGGNIWWECPPELGGGCHCPGEGSSNASISADGRHVAFESSGCNLPWGENAKGIFMHDRVTEETTRLVVDNGLVRPRTWSASLSGDGRYVACVSSASYLVANDTNNANDVFLRDRVTERTWCVSMGMGGATGMGSSWGPSISGDGRFVAFQSSAPDLAPGDYNSTSDIFVYDREANETTLVSKTDYEQSANGTSRNPCISPDGRYVSFESGASNLVDDDTNGVTDIFLYDREMGEMERVSVSTEGVETDGASGASCVNATGRFVVFDSIASNLRPNDLIGVWDVFLRDRSWTTFDDVRLDYWAYGEIEACFQAEIVNGYADATYHPEEAVSRDQMAAFVSRALAGGDSNVPEGPETASFDDVPIDYWAYQYVEFAVAQGVVRGYPVGDQRLYRPTNAVDRGQMGVFIARAHAGGDENVAEGPPSPTFADVTSGNEWQWCYDHVEYVAVHDIACGYEDDLYHPEYTCSRDQMAVFIARAFDLLP